MRISCNKCGRTVSTEVSENTIMRAWCECPECIEQSPDFEDLLLDVLFQACGVIIDKKPAIDNQCISSFEKACDYLTEKGFLLTKDGRIYFLKKQ